MSQGVIDFVGAAGFVLGEGDVIAGDAMPWSYP
jgi:hypothetical protein